MSIPTDSAMRSAVRDSGATSEKPKSAAASRPVSNATKSNLATSIQTLKDLASKSGTNFAAPAPSGLMGEPLSTAYEKRIRKLQDTLKERDQVVQMLTQRLEQAADQLDRMQRSGGGRGGSVAGLSPELIENQQSLVEQLTRVLGEWEETQAGQTLTRIESRITELRELFSSGSIAPASFKTSDSTSNLITKRLVDPPPKTSAGASVFSDILSADPRKVGWEAIKAAMMDNAGTTAAVSSPEPNASREAPASPISAVEPVVAEERTGPAPLPEPPPAVDFDIADQEMLIEAIHSRDAFISALLRRLSSPDANTEYPDWEKLNFVPEDLHRELISLRDRMREKLRAAEVDLSLQRAKLAREEAKLAIKAEQVARQMRQLGLSADEPAPQPSSTQPMNEGSNATQGRRWLQFLQRSNGSGSGTDAK